MATTQKAVMFCGDSITFGYYDFAAMGYRGKTLMSSPHLVATGNNLDRTLPPVGAAAIYNLFFGISRSKNQGTNGQTITGMNSVIAARIASANPSPDYITIHLGVNDALGGDSGSTMLTNLATLLDTTHVAAGSAVVMVAQIINTLYLSGAYSGVISTYNAGIPALVSARSAWCKMATMPTLTAAQFGDWQTIHPNAWGHQRMALEGWIPAFAAAGW